MHRFEKREISGSEFALASAEVPVRFQDVDAAGIVFFARFFDYVHEAYEVFLESTGHSLKSIIDEGAWAAPLRHAEADYLSPARFGDLLLVELSIAHLGETEMALGWRITSQEEKSRLVAVAQTVHAFVSLPAFERRSVPEAIAARLALD